MTTAKDIFDHCLPDLIHTVSLLERSDLEAEHELHRAKRFDYRYLPPLQATVKFYESYQRCFQRKSRATVDIREVPFKTGVSSKGFLKSGRQFTSFWRARQFADRLGVPYDVFFEHSMELLMRAGWQRLPHINQLTAGKNWPRIAAAVKTGWQEHLDNFLMISEAPPYTVPSFRGLHSQKDHRD